MNFKKDKENQDSIKFGCVSNILYLVICVKAAFDVFCGNAYSVKSLSLALACLLCAIYLNYKKKMVLKADADKVSMKRLAFEAVLMVMGLVAVYLYVEQNKLNLMFAFPPALAIAPAGQSTRKLNVAEGYIKVKSKKRAVTEKALYTLAWLYFIYYAVMIKCYG